MSGEQWGQYVIDAKIGAGGMAEVFRGWRVGAAGFKREVCIKRIRSEHTENADMLALFKDEANTGSYLRHKNIVSTDDVFEHDGHLSIVMEFVNGKNLREVENSLRSTRIAMPLDAALYIAHELLAALQAAHTAVDKGRPLRIVHRDVSPANTLVSFTGEVKLTDFGIAHAATRAHQTAADQARGQPMYMPYEQLSGKVDARADLFAFGGLLFELLAGRLAFGDGLPASPLAALAQKRDDMRVSLGTVRPDLSPALIRLVDRLLSFHPDQRPSSAQEALDVVCSLPEFSATGSRSLQLLMEQLYPSQGSIAAIPIDSALRNSRPSGVPAVRASSDPAMKVTEPDATIPDQRAMHDHAADATSPARPAARTPRAGPIDAYAPTQARPSLLVVGDDVSAPPVNTAGSDAHGEDRRGVPMWAIAMGAAMLLGASAVTITTMRNRDDASATTPPITSTSESLPPPPTTVLAPSTPFANASDGPAAPTTPPSTTQSAIAAPPIANVGEAPHANAQTAHNANPSHASTPPPAVVAPTIANAPTPAVPPAAPSTHENNANHAGDETPTQSAQTQTAAQTTGTLRVVALPWGEVFVDGTAHGRAPVSMRVSSGEHTVRITGGVEHTERVVVAAGATRTVTAEGE